VEKNAAFAAKFGFPFLLLCDVNRAIGMAYGACDSPKARFAKRITYVVGPDRRIVRSDPEVSAKKHPGELLATL